MGFWYLLMLLIGVLMIGVVIIKRTIKMVIKVTFLVIAVCLIAFAIFMFLDGSAEIVDGILKWLNIDW